MLRSPLLLHIPHASTCIPDDACGDFVVDRDTLDAELLRLTDRFTDRGFRVGVNRPFAGALVPNAYYGLDPRVQSVMIEVRRDLYMDERTGERLPGFADVQRVLTDFRALLEASSLARG